MGPHIRPSHQIINIPPETPTGISSDMSAKAREAFNHTFGGTVNNPPADPFAGLTNGAPVQGPLATPNDRLGTGLGSGLHPQDRIVTSGPLETFRFRPGTRRSDPALAGAGLGHRDGFQAPRPSLGALARHGGRPQVQAPAARPQPALGDMHLSAQRNAHDPLAGTRPRVEVGPRHAPQAPNTTVAQRAETATDRQANFAIKVATIRSDIALARLNLSDASSPLLAHQQKSNALTQAQSRFANAQSALRELQADPNLSRNERLELSRLSREPDFRNFDRDAHEADFNLRLDNAVRDI